MNEYDIVAFGAKQNRTEQRKDIDRLIIDEEGEEEDATVVAMK